MKQITISTVESIRSHYMRLLSKTLDEFEKTTDSTEKSVLKEREGMIIIFLEDLNHIA